MAVPTPPPGFGAGPAVRQQGDLQRNEPQPDLPQQDAPQLDVLDEVRARLDALDDRPLHEHPEQFAAVDRLLRSALDDAGRTEPDRAGSR